MRVQVVGSWLGSLSKKKWSFIGKESEFQKVCTIIGKAIAIKGYTLNVSSLDKKTADYWVIRGYLQEIDSTRNIENHKIELYIHKNNLHTIKDNISKDDLFLKYGDLFLFKVFDEFWESLINSAKDSDIIITIGGDKGVFLIGLISIMMNKKLIPVVSFGGASLEIARQKYLNISNNIMSKFVFRASDSFVEDIIKLISPNVFIIHGKDEDWEKLKIYLDSRNINTIILEEKFISGLTIPKKFEYIASQADFAIALLTPDDIGALANITDQKKRQFKKRARQNILIEIGWFWGKLGINRILILQKGDIEVPSDLQGIEVIKYKRLNNDVLSEVYNKLAESLKLSH